ncbi:hypothetical protein DFH09DRAFT_1398769 [Mycena vulgaris]|nr:hypothetical protein DFH09DRAFT_1398769 [Mycena vulgaris]
MATGIESQDSALPIELERDIFEITAFLDPRSILKLILLASRVKTWIEPILYRVISVTESHRINRRRITSATWLKMLESKPASFFHAHVCHVALTSMATAHELVHGLSKCGGTLNLGLFQVETGVGFLASIAKMPLRRLATDLKPLFGSRNVDMGHSIFSRLTHLDLFDVDDYASHEWPARFSQIPCLTHLSFNLTSHRMQDHHALFHGVLSHCKLLEVLILVCSDEHLLLERLEDYHYFGDDARSVLMAVDDFLEDWEISADGGADYWVRAESFIRKRNCGEIERKFHRVERAADSTPIIVPA